MVFGSYENITIDTVDSGLSFHIKDGNLARDYDDVAQKVYEENRDLALDLLNDYNEWTKAAENNDRTFFEEKPANAD